MDHRIDARERRFDALPTGQVGHRRFHSGGQMAGVGGGPHQAANRLPARAKIFHEMAADEAGAASDENHYSGVLRKATSPK